MARGVRDDRRAARPGRRGDRRLALRERPARCARCASRSASSPSSTRRGRTSRSTPRRCALKSGNAILLRGSSSAAHSNAVLAARRARGRRGQRAARGRARARRRRRARGARRAGRPGGLVDLIIPRGGEGLKKALSAVAKVPVIYAASGNCHVYVDASADLDDAQRDRPQREDPAARRLQRRRDAARPRRRRRRVPAAARCGRCTTPASSCAATSACARRPAASRSPRRPTRTTPRSSSRWCSPCGWSTRPRTRSSTSTRSAPATRRRS